MGKFSNFVDKYNSSYWRKQLESFFNSHIFPVVMAGIILLCYYLGWDMVMIWAMAISAIAMLFSCKDLTPIFFIFLFLNIIISFKNSPSKLGNESNYFLTPVIYIQIIIAISLCVTGVVIRVVYNIKMSEFKISPMFYGICALAGAFVLSGSFAPDYTPMNIVYGIFLAAIYIGIFMLVSTSVSANESTFKKIAFYCCVFFIVLAIELIVAYVTYDNIIVNGYIDRSKIFFGWGMYNTIGMLFCVCIPAWFYLAITSRYSFIYTVFGLGNIIIVFYTMSRQNMLGAAIIGIACIIWLLIERKGKERLINLFIVIAATIIVGIFIGVNLDVINYYLKGMIDNIMENGGNRVDLWQRAWEDFLKAPIFGVGFYYLKDLDVGYVGLDIIPKMYHNTLLQMLWACGIVGIVAYLFHRAQTIISFLKNINQGRIYLAVTICGLLFVSLFDNHMFYIFPTIVYVGLIGILKSSENKNEQVT